MKYVQMNIKSDNDGVIPSGPDAEYDRSPTVSLSDAQITALGITQLPKTGTEFTLVARAVVYSASSSDYEGDGKPNLSLSFRLPELCLESGAAPDHAKSIYGA